MNFANTTLGEMLSHSSIIIKRNALSILKQLQRERDEGIKKCDLCQSRPNIKYLCHEHDAILPK